MTPLFIATEKLDRSDGQKWSSYIEWAKIPNLIEIVSLDSRLCPCIVHALRDEDWQFNVQENYRLHYFYNLAYLLQRVEGEKRRNILGLYRNPDHHIEVAPGPGAFCFVGYDLIEDMTGISALTDCGGFPESFSNDELNSYGLLTDFARASEVKRLLIENNPAEPHANCELYAIWRLTEVNA